MTRRPSRRSLGLAVVAGLAVTPLHALAQSLVGESPPAVELYRDVAGVTVVHRGRRALSLELTAEEQALQRAGAGATARPMRSCPAGSKTA